MILGFTGTRNPITPFQRLWLHLQLAEEAKEFHHGACLGADAASHRVALQHAVDVVVHPPYDQRLMMNLPVRVQDLYRPVTVDGITYFPAKPYHERNRDIVAAAERLIALPDGPQRPRSGTWYTVDYAEKTGVPVSICYPDGTVEQR